MESDILRPEVTITVTSREPQTSAPNTSQIPGGGQRRANSRGNVAKDDEEEVTVVDNQDIQFRGLPTYIHTIPQQSPIDVSHNSTRTDAQRVVRLLLDIP